MHKIGLLLLFSLLIINTSALADSKKDLKINSSIISKQLKACGEAPDERGIRSCICQVSTKTERYLKKLESSIANQLDSKEKELFLQSSKAWSNYVNLTCQFDTESLGSIQGSVACSCHIELQLSRIKALENYEKCLQTKDCERPYLLYRDLSSEK